MNKTSRHASGLVATAAMLVAPAVMAQAPAPAPAPQVAPGAPPPVVVAPGLAPVTQPVPAAQWTVAQMRQSFALADANSDGQLTRGEAARLSLLPLSFEDADRNKDGVLDAAEYESTFPR
jgi:hypothetical protein